MIYSNSLVMPYLEERSTKNILPSMFQATSRKNLPAIDHAKHFMHCTIKLFYCPNTFLFKGFLHDILVFARV